MGFIKSIFQTFRAIKKSKEDYRNNLAVKKNLIDSSLITCGDDKKLKEQWEKTFQEFKSKGNYSDRKMLVKYYDGKITQQEYEEHRKAHKRMVEHKIKEVEDGKMTYQEFFKTIS